MAKRVVIPPAAEWLEVLKKSPGFVAHLGASGDKQDRHHIRIKREKLITEGTFSKLRMTDPEEVSKLIASINATGGAPLYDLLVWAQPSADGFNFVLVDGFQRFRGMMDREFIDCTIPQWWTTEEVVLKEAPMCNFVRYEVADPDALRILTLRAWTAGEAVKALGMDEDRVRKLMLISEHPVLIDAVSKNNAVRIDGQVLKGAPGQFIGYTTAAKLVAACNKNDIKIKALMTEFSRVFNLAKMQAFKIDQDIQNNPKKKFSRSYKKKRYLEYWGKRYTWENWKEALENGEVENKQFFFQPESEGYSGNQAITVSDDESEWQKKWAVTGLTEDLDWDKVDPDDLENLINEWPFILKKLKRALVEQRRNDGKEEEALPTSVVTAMKNAKARKAEVKEEPKEDAAEEYESDEDEDSDDAKSNVDEDKGGEKNNDE